MLFISAGKAKLADIIPLTSKKGVDVADTCMQACTLSGLLDIEILKNKIAGITGDGAFAKGNAPFKSRISELLGKAVVVRWDPLHLINRAHIEARGKIHCADDNEESGDDVSEDEDEEKHVEEDKKHR